MKTLYKNTTIDAGNFKKFYGNLCTTNKEFVVEFTDLFGEPKVQKHKWCWRLEREFDFVSHCIAVFGLQTVIDFYKENKYDIPSPEGYAELHEGTTVKLWHPWKETGYRTALNPIKLGMIEQLASIAPSGKFYELGVYTGGVSKMLLDMGKDVVCFDTFKGISGAKDEEYHSDGEYNGGGVFDYVKGAEIVAGELPATLYGRCDDIAFVHFDLDVELPTAACIEYVWNRLVTGGIMVFDDYGTWTTFGVKRAVDNFKFGKKLYLPTGQMVIIK